MSATTNRRFVATFGREADILGATAAVRAHGLSAGLVDNKVCAIDETWSGLRFCWRRADR